MDFTAVLHPMGHSVYLHNKLELSPLSQFALEKSDDCREEDHAIALSGLSGDKARLNNTVKRRRLFSCRWSRFHQRTERDKKKESNIVRVSRGGRESTSLIV
jgi:hypothetical protein